MPKIALGITELLEILGRDYGIEEPYWGPSCLSSLTISTSPISISLVAQVKVTSP